MSAQSIKKCTFRFAPAGVLFVLVAFVASCVSVPQYDATTDTNLTNLQKEVDSELVLLISLQREGDPASLKKAAYQQSIDFYNRVDTDLTSVELRMEAVPDPSTSNLPQIFANLRAEFGSLQDTHRQQVNLDEHYLIPVRNLLNVQFASLLTYELSLKGVQTPSTATTSSTAVSTATAKSTKTP
jgi:hypothetical protein